MDAISVAESARSYMLTSSSRPLKKNPSAWLIINGAFTFGMGMLVESTPAATPSVKIVKVVPLRTTAKWDH
jgi:hypothetical protein